MTESIITVGAYQYRLGPTGLVETRRQDLGEEGYGPWEASSSQGFQPTLDRCAEWVRLLTQEKGQ